MIAAAVSLLAMTLAADANWSIVVTRTGHVAAREALAESIAKGVQAQPHCALGVYVPPSEWKAPPKNGTDLAGCSTSTCLEQLAREAGIDRLVALRLNQGFETILVQASVVEVANSAVTEFETTQVAEDALEADARRVAETICTRLPQREVTTPLPPQAAASRLSPRRFGTGPLVCAAVSASALVASGAFMGMGARQTTIVRDTVFSNLEERDAAMRFGKAMNVGAYTSLGISVLAAGVGTALWLLDERRPQLTFQLVPGNGGAHATIEGRF